MKTQLQDTEGKPTAKTWWNDDEVIKIRNKYCSALKSCMAFCRLHSKWRKITGY